MDFNQGMALLGFGMALGLNILALGMAWGALRGRLNQIGDAVNKLTALLEKHDDKIDELDRSQVRTKERIGSAFRQIDELKKQAGG